MTKKSKFAALLLALSLSAAACGSDDPEATEVTNEAPADDSADEATDDAMEDEEAMEDELPATVVDIASDAGSFTTLLAAAEAAGLVDALTAEGPITVFAPTDDAFAAALTDLGLTAEELLADTDTLTSILTYHVLEGKVLSTDVTDGMTAATLNGAEITVSVDGSAVMIDGATVIAADLEAQNGVVHVIDGVLLPSADDAMEDEDAMEEELPATVVDIASEAGSFTTLLAAAEAAGLVDALTAEGPITVFAPTDDAFAAALTDLGLTAEELLADTDTLTSILTYHVVDGKVLSTDLSDGMSAATLNGAEITVAIDGSTVMIDGATVTAADLEAQNGVVHVIDTVLLP